jgi:hypothetical protein
MNTLEMKPADMKGKAIREADFQSGVAFRVTGGLPG